MISCAMLLYARTGGRREAAIFTSFPHKCLDEGGALCITGIIQYSSALAVPARTAARVYDYNGILRCHLSRWIARNGGRREAAMISDFAFFQTELPLADVDKSNNHLHRPHCGSRKNGGMDCE